MYAIPQNDQQQQPQQQPQGYAVIQPQQMQPQQMQPQQIQPQQFTYPYQQPMTQQQQPYQYQQAIPQQIPQQMPQQIPQQTAVIQPGEQTQNQYYYFYGNGQPLTDITPTPQMVQNEQLEEKINYQQLSNALSSPKLIEDDLINEAPTSPGLLYNTRNNTYSMPIRNIEISTELHIATAFVSMKITFENTSNSKVNTLFVLPCNGTVTSTKVNINNGSRYLDTTFIDNDCAKQFQPKQRKTRNANEIEQPINTYIPNLFRLPIADIAKNESVTVEIDYMQNLEFVESRYHFYIPLNFGNEILPNINNNISIKCSINCITPGIQYGSTTHNLILTQQENLRCKLIAQPKQLTNNRDFHLFYSVKTNAISAALLYDNGSEYEYDPLKSFTCFVNPPSKIQGIFQRDIIFLLDRSGSMTGKPYTDAVQGLIFALNTLTQNDRFTIIAFDHEQIFFDINKENNYFGNNDINNNFQLFQAFPNTIQQAIYFLNNIQARGMTDIKTPLMKSINYLNNNYNKQNIPFVVLLTDGAVENEKNIVCDLINLNENNKTRILTFGIGRYCNEYFLKMLSLTTRGWNDGCIYPKDLYPKIRLMMDKAKTPILTDIQLDIPINLKNINIYPKSIPDLFMNGPIIISGKYCGDMPKQIILKGKLQNGQILAIPIRTDISQIIPINKIFIKQRMDQLNSQYWLNGNEKIKQEIINISINETFPSPYTSMIAYQLTPKEKKEQDKKLKEENNNNNKKSKGLSGGQIAALTGGAIVVGAGVFLLGNVVATMGNINIIDGIGGGIGDIGQMIGNIDCPCDNCMNIISCGNCDCGMLAGIGSCGICANCNECLDIIPCGECNGGCIELPGCNAIGDICESCGGVVGGCFDSIGDGCGNICECIPNCIGGVGDLFGNIGEICGGVCGCIGEIGGGIGDIAAGLCDCIGAIVKTVGDL